MKLVKEQGSDGSGSNIFAEKSSKKRKANLLEDKDKSSYLDFKLNYI